MSDEDGVRAAFRTLLGIVVVAHPLAVEREGSRDRDRLQLDDERMHTADDGPLQAASAFSEPL